MKAVMDSSALLALIWKEPGGEVTRAILADSEAFVSAVNLAEVCTKLADRGSTGDAVRSLLEVLALRIVPYDENQALRTGELRLPTRAFGLSIGDRACLGLAEAESATAVTADKSWVGLNLGIDVKTIR
jgi:ribonuclease VapC